MLVKEANMKKLHKKDPTQPLPEQINLVDAYLTWFPLGIFGWWYRNDGKVVSIEISNPTSPGFR